MRARYHEVLAHEIQIRSTGGNLISGYHRDFQCTKRPLMQSFAVTAASLDVLTLVIGGLTSEREQDIQNKVPILGDIPLLGFFFRSTFEEVERQHVLFAISPRIIQRSDFEADL